MRRRTLVVLRTSLLLLVASFLASCAVCPGRPGPTAEAPPAEAVRQFTIIGNSDIHGQLDPTLTMRDADGDGTEEKVEAGGIARAATLIAAIEAERPGRVAAVAPGDALMDRYFHVFGGEAIFGLMSEAGYEVFALGNHEFDKGPEGLAAALGSARFDVLCTDLATGGTVLDGRCARTVLLDYDGLKVGYFSLMTEDLPFVTSAGGIEHVGTNVEAARWAVGELTRGGAELIVALTHVGEHRDRELAGAVQGIDLIFGGHSHRCFAEPERVGETLIVNGGERGTELVRLDLAILPDGTIDFPRTAYHLIPVAAPVSPDPEVERALAGYRASFPEAIVLGRTDVGWDLRSEVVRGGECPVANLVNDLLREKFKADIVLNNAGAFRGKKLYDAGPVTDVMLKEIDEFGNYAYTLDLEGRHLAEILERSAACFGEGGLMHASGLRYTIDLRGRAQELEENEAGEWSVTVPGGRVSDAVVLGPDGTWVPLDSARTYRVLTNSFIVDRAGDGYFWFGRHGRDLRNTYATFTSIMGALAESAGVLNPPEPDGRLAVVR